jgi:hypothetical protein
MIAAFVSAQFEREQGLAPRSYRRTHGSEPAAADGFAAPRIRNVSARASTRDAVPQFSSS